MSRLVATPDGEVTVTRKVHASVAAEKLTTALTELIVFDTVVGDTVAPVQPDTAIELLTGMLFPRLSAIRTVTLPLNCAAIGGVAAGIAGRVTTMLRPTSEITASELAQTIRDTSLIRVTPLQVPSHVFITVLDVPAQDAFPGKKPVISWSTPAS